MDEIRDLLVEIRDLLREMVEGSTLVEETVEETVLEIEGGRLKKKVRVKEGAD